MKMTKKFFAAALAVAALSLVGCNMNEDEYGILDFDAPNGVCTIDYTNETKDYIRGWATFNTKRETANCTITIKNQDSKSKDGNMGYIFNLNDNGDGTYNFVVATLQYNAAENQGLRTYISYYTNVGAAYLSGDGANFKDIDGIQIGSKNCKAAEVAIVKGEGTSAWLPNIGPTPNANKEISVFVEMTCNEDNGYTVSYYNTDANGKKTGDAFFAKTFTNSLEKDPTTGKWIVPENGLGVYANVLPGKTLTGSWKFYDIQGNAIPLELAD